MGVQCRFSGLDRRKRFASGSRLSSVRQAVGPESHGDHVLRTGAQGPLIENSSVACPHNLSRVGSNYPPSWFSYPLDLTELSGIVPFDPVSCAPMITAELGFLSTARSNSLGPQKYCCLQS